MYHNPLALVKVDPIMDFHLGLAYIRVEVS